MDMSALASSLPSDDTGGMGLYYWKVYKETDSKYIFVFYDDEHNEWSNIRYGNNVYVYDPTHEIEREFEQERRKEDEQ